VQGVLQHTVDSFGLSVSVGAPPDPEDGLANLSPAERLAAKRRKKEVFRQQLEQCPDDVKTLWRLTRVFLDLNEVEEFVAFAQDFCRRHRSTWRNISRVLRKFNRERDALQLLLEVHREDPHNAEVCITLAKLDPNRSRSWYEQALKADPRCVEALLAIADELRKVDRNFSEAARYYEAAHRQCPSTDRRLHFKTLRRMGECLVQLDGRGEEGRKYLKQVLEDLDGASEHMHSATMIAMSYTLTQQHDNALVYCQKAEEIHRRAPLQHYEPTLKHAMRFKGITLLRKGEIERAIDTLEGAIAGTENTAGNEMTEELRSATQMIECTLGYAETLHGDLAAAERHLDRARALSGAHGGADVLVNLAYVKQAQGNSEEAQSLLQQCLASDKNNALALLRMGYIYLCQEQYEQAIQFLQKCLQQPTEQLTYGPQEKGTAHLYLCIAYHCRDGGSAGGGRLGSNTSEPGSGAQQLAEEQFRFGYELQPDMARKLAELEVVMTPGASLFPGRQSLMSSTLSMSTSSSVLPLTGQHLVSGMPPRMGSSDLLSKQASVLLLYAERAGKVPSSVLRPQIQAPTSTPSVASRGEVAYSPLTASARRPLVSASAAASVLGACQNASVPIASPVTDESASKPGLSGSRQLLGSSGKNPTLVGTASTAAGTSCGPSRDASDRDLHNIDSAARASLLQTPASGPSSTGGAPAGVRAANGTSVLSRSAQGHPALSEESIAAARELSARLPPEKLLQFSEIDMGECISCGEFAIVHRGTIRGSRQTDVVVKTLHQRECLHDDQAAAELRAEIAVIAELSHPRLVTFVGACLEPSCVALVTELAPGGNLHQALHVRRRRLQRRERFQLSTELLEGVRYLHARTPPIAHLDLKSMNLVLDAEGQHLQICDFGLARAMGSPSDGDGVAGGSSSSEGDRPPNRGGSPRYMSPECHDSTLGALTEKADVWSSGCILIEIFGETLPYAECSNVHQILKLMLVHRCGPDIPATVEAPVRTIIGCTLAFEAQERLAIAQVLLRLESVPATSGGEIKSRFTWNP